MKKSLLALAFLLPLAMASAPANAQQNGPYYANPSWDQQIPAAQRFIILSNWNSEAVLDRETGLVWQRTPGSEGPNYSVASFICRSTPIGGRYGWRLPTVEELSSLLDPNTATGLPVGHPFIGTIFGRYWTTSTLEGVPGFVYAPEFGVPSISGTVNIPFGSSPNGSPKTDPDTAVWCVRGGSSLQSSQ